MSCRHFNTSPPNWLIVLDSLKEPILRTRHVTWKVWLSLAEPPFSEQVTVAVEVPGLVVVPTFHVQLTPPDESATGWACSPVALEIVPDAYWTVALQVAPGEVTATIVALAP